MVASVTAVLSRFKTEWATQLQPEAIIGACTHLPHLSGLRFRASADCQASTKLPLNLCGLL
jgi:hypothetical protein